MTEQLSIHSLKIYYNEPIKKKDKDTMAAIKKTGPKARMWRKENSYTLLMGM